HDQEVAREVEPADELEVVRDLMARARRERAGAVARPDAAFGQLAEVAERRLTGGERELRESVSEILQREGEPQRQLSGVGDGVGEISEQRCHLPPALQRALAVREEPTARAVEAAPLAAPSFIRVISRQRFW